MQKPANRLVIFLKDLSLSWYTFGSLRNSTQVLFSSFQFILRLDRAKSSNSNEVIAWSVLLEQCVKQNELVLGKLVHWDIGGLLSQNRHLHRRSNDIIKRQRGRKTVVKVHNWHALLKNHTKALPIKSGTVKVHQNSITKPADGRQNRSPAGFSNMITYWIWASVLFPLELQKYIYLPRH